MKGWGTIHGYKFWEPKHVRKGLIRIPLRTLFTEDIAITLTLFRCYNTLL